MTQPVQLSLAEAAPAAPRLVNTRRMDRSDCLEARKTVIGGSEAAASVGLCPCKSQLELWLEKSGRDSRSAG